MEAEAKMRHYDLRRGFDVVSSLVQAAASQRGSLPELGAALEAAEVARRGWGGNGETSGTGAGRDRGSVRR